MTGDVGRTQKETSACNSATTVFLLGSSEHSNLVARQIETLKVFQLAQSFRDPSHQLISAVKVSHVYAGEVAGIPCRHGAKYECIFQHSHRTHSSACAMPRPVSRHTIRNGEEKVKIISYRPEQLCMHTTHPNQSSRRSVVPPRLSGI